VPQSVKTEKISSTKTEFLLASFTWTFGGGVLLTGSSAVRFDPRPPPAPPARFFAAAFFGVAFGAAFALLAVFAAFVMAILPPIGTSRSSRASPDCEMPSKIHGTHLRT
jgi:hypothetical protein